MKKLGISLMLTILMVGMVSGLPLQYHGADEVVQGSFGDTSGNFTFPEDVEIVGDVNVSGSSKVFTPELCLNGDCQTSWPSGSSIWTNTSGNATFVSGSVGIGTSSPGSTLHVKGIDPAGVIQAQKTTTTTGTIQNILLLRSLTSNNMVDGFGGQILFNIEDNSTTSNNIGSIGFSRSGQDNSSEFGINVYNNGVTTRGLTINPNGYVGIGTTDPSEKLDVTGNIELAYSASNLYTLRQEANDNWYGYIIPFSSTGMMKFATEYDGNGGGFHWFVDSSEKMRISPNGNVGIGTTNPTYNLDLLNSADNGVIRAKGTGSYKRGILILETTDTGAGSGRESGRISFQGPDSTAVTEEYATIIAQQTSTTNGTEQGDLIFRARQSGQTISNSEAMRITSTGNVGIGTNTPGEKLEVDGNINVTTGNDICIEGGNCLSTVSSGSGEWTDAGPYIYANNNNTIVVTDDGKIGIGTTAPGTYSLHTTGPIKVGGWITQNNSQWLAGTKVDGTIGGIVEVDSNDDLILNSFYLRDVIITDGGGITAPNMIIKSNPTAVGIGTASPSTSLEVSKNTLSASSSVQPALRVVNTNTTQGDGSSTVNSASMYLDATNGGMRFMLQAIDDTAGNGAGGHVRVTTADPIYFWTSNVKRMTIDSSGNVGIGTSSPDDVLHVFKGDSGATPHSFSTVNIENAGNNMVSVLTNNVSNGYYGFGDSEDDFRAGMQYYHGDDSLTFWGNNDVRIKVLSDGDVGIGTATPTQKLHIEGSANITSNIWYGGNITGYGADFAEKFGTNEELEEGDVVCLEDNGKVSKCKNSGDNSVVGIVSFNPTIIGNGGQDGVPIGIVGIVPTKVKGPINKFDLITPSPGGYGEKASIENFGAIVGKAMESCEKDECVIKVLVGMR